MIIYDKKFRSAAGKKIYNIVSAENNLFFKEIRATPIE